MSSLFRAFTKRNASKPDAVPEPDFKGLQAASNFNSRELKKLFTRFCFLCNEAGYVERIPFVQQAEFAFCPLISMAFDYECRCQERDAKLKAYALRGESKSDDESNGKQIDGLNDADSDELGNEKKGNSINFNRFVKLLNEFSPKMSLHRKATCKIRYHIIPLQSTHPNLF